jgi:hypothetical protein
MLIDADRLSEIMIVIAGVVLTLLIGGALLYWIDREWRHLDAQQRRQDTIPPPSDTPDPADDPSTVQPPED